MDILRVLHAINSIACVQVTHWALPTRSLHLLLNTNGLDIMASTMSAFMTGTRLAIGAKAANTGNKVLVDRQPTLRSACHICMLHERALTTSLEGCRSVHGPYCSTVDNETAHKVQHR